MYRKLTQHDWTTGKSYLGRLKSLWKDVTTPPLAQLVADANGNVALDRGPTIIRNWQRWVARKLVQRTWSDYGRMLHHIKALWRAATPIHVNLPKRQDALPAEDEEDYEYGSEWHVV